MPCASFAGFVPLVHSAAYHHGTLPEDGMQAADTCLLAATVELILRAACIVQVFSCGDGPDCPCYQAEKSRQAQGAWSLAERMPLQAFAAR